MDLYINTYTKNLSSYKKNFLISQDCAPGAVARQIRRLIKTLLIIFHCFARFLSLTSPAQNFITQISRRAAYRFLNYALRKYIIHCCPLCFPENKINEIIWLSHAHNGAQFGIPVECTYVCLCV